MNWTALALDPETALSLHVKIKETICRCGRCGFYKVAPDVLALFEVVREAWEAHRKGLGLNHPTDFALHITSGARCLEHQMAVNAASLYKDHVVDVNEMGHAVDVLKPWGVDSGAFYAVVQAVVDTVQQAALGNYAWGVHIGIQPGTPDRRRWNA